MSRPTKEDPSYDTDPTPLASALARLIPKTCLPSAFEDYQDLADHLTVELSGTLVLIPKEEADRLYNKLSKLTTH